MSYRPLPTLFVSVAIAAISPVGHFTRDCSPRIEICAPSDAAYLPDEPAPEHAPPMIFAPPTASYTSSAPSGPEMMYQFKTT